MERSWRLLELPRQSWPIENGTHRLDAGACETACRVSSDGLHLAAHLAWRHPMRISGPGRAANALCPAIFEHLSGQFDLALRRPQRSLPALQRPSKRAQLHRFLCLFQLLSSMKRCKKAPEVTEAFK